jgi:hypothetical protein
LIFLNLWLGGTHRVLFGVERLHINESQKGSRSET